MRELLKETQNLSSILSRGSSTHLPQLQRAMMVAMNITPKPST